MCAEHIRILSSGKNQGYGNELYGEVDMRSRFDEIKKIAPTERVMRLRKAVLDAKPILCSERAVAVTKSYRETEGMHYIERRARAFYRILDEMTLNI